MRTPYPKLWVPRLWVLLSLVVVPMAFACSEDGEPGGAAATDGGAAGMSGAAAGGGAPAGGGAGGTSGAATGGAGGDLGAAGAAVGGGAGGAAAGGGAMAAGGRAPGGGAGGGAAEGTCPGGDETVRFTTDDGVELVADIHTVGLTGMPGVVLLHMIPPGNDRTGWDPAFIRALVDDFEIDVIKVDRRGAGDSGGVAREAYEGPKGALDVKAARAALLAHPCAPDPTRIAVLGASNGSTSTLDYTLTAPEAERPRAIGFLTGGGYTENQHPVAEHRAVLDAMPLLFVFSTAERAWSAGFMEGAPATWTFLEYADGAHGTRMLGAAPASQTDIADWLDDVLRGAP